MVCFMVVAATVKCRLACNAMQKTVVTRLMVPQNTAAACNLVYPDCAPVTVYQERAENTHRSLKCLHMRSPNHVPQALAL